MCMITFVPEGCQPDAGALYNGSVYNDDGHGFAMIIDGKIKIARGWYADALISEFAALKRKYPMAPALFHSRMATHGPTDRQNIHPFYLGNDRSTVVAHNGVFSQLSRVMPKVSARSDTRYWAEVFVPKHPKMSLLTTVGRRMSERWMGRFNKVVMLTTNPRAKRQSFILNEDVGIWEDGLWYSNDDYLGHPKYATAFTSGYWQTTKGGRMWVADSKGEVGTEDFAFWTAEDDEQREAYQSWLRDHSVDSKAKADDKCTFCDGQGTISVLTDICDICQMCNACSQAALMCQCY